MKKVAHVLPAGARSAFTLLELLVTIAVIGVISSLLLTSVLNAKHKGKVTACLSNMKQVVLGLQMYVDDNHGRLPLRVSQKGSTGVAPIPGSSFFDYRFFDWAIGGAEPLVELPTIPRAKERPLYPYIQQAETFRCPLDAGAYVEPYSETSNRKLFHAFGCSYWYNVGHNNIPNPVLGLEGIAGKSISLIKDPSRFILLYEAPAQNGDNPKEQFKIRFWHASNRSLSALAFADLHVAELDFSKVRPGNAAYPNWSEIPD